MTPTEMADDLGGEADAVAGALATASVVLYHLAARQANVHATFGASLSHISTAQETESAARYVVSDAIKRLTSALKQLRYGAHLLRKVPEQVMPPAVETPSAVG